MTETAVPELVVLPPVAADPVFDDLSFEPSLPEPARLIGADPHDFAGLFIKHKWSFQLHARRFLSDQRDIDEVVQEGFLKLFLAMPELETELQALAYARRTITNLCIDRYRADQRRPRLVDLETIPLESLTDEDESDPVVQAEDAALVREAMALLSPLHREALIKRELEEKPLPQIAEELDIPVEQVKHLLHRARRALRRLLAGTHLEPGVDLDLATMIELNRARAARAAKPAGIAVLALLMVLAGVLGLRPGGRPTNTVADIPVGPVGSLDGLLDHPVVPAPVKVAGPAAPTLTATTPTKPVPARRGTSSTPVTRRPTRPALPSRLPVAAPAAGTPASAPVPPTSSPVTPVASAFRVSGVYSTSAAHISNQQRALRADRLVSSSTLTAPTITGVYQLTQAFAFDRQGALSDVALTESLPAADGTIVDTQVTGSSTTSDVASDGTVNVLTVGSAMPADADAAFAQPRQIQVSLVLDAQRVVVLAESVLITGGLPEVLPSPAAVASPNAVQGVPQTPLPPARPAPAPSIEPQEPADQVAAVAVQTAATG